MAEINVDIASDGRSLAAALGDEVVVRLDEIPTSGYRWEVREFDPAVLERLDDEFTPFAGAGLGAGGTHEFRFRVVGRGQTALRLTHRRSWEPATAAADELNTTVAVTD